MRDRQHDPVVRRPHPRAPGTRRRKESDAETRGPERGATLAVLAATAALGAFVLVGDAAPAEAQQASADGPRAEKVEKAAADAGQEKSLYERLGGLYPIASVVDVFIDLLLHNDVVNENPAIRKARDRVPTPGLKYHVTAMICQATGGPCEYTGRSMEAAHAHLNIGEREWKAMLSDFRRTLNDFQVPEQEQEELVAIVQSTKDDIVVEE